MASKVYHRLYDGSPDGPCNADDKPCTATGEHLLLWWCQGCRCLHLVRIAAANTRPNEPVWGYNGDDNAPTFTPSVLNKREGHVCHVFVKAGEIQYLNDCTHDHAGKTVQMRDWEDVTSGKVDSSEPE